jgi:hypothetical protein
VFRSISLSAAFALLSGVAAAQQTLPTPTGLHFWVDGQALFMTQELGDRALLSTTAGKGDILSARDVEPDQWEPGFEGAIGVDMGRWGVEARGFWLDTLSGKSSTTTVQPGGNVTFEFNSPQAIGVAGVPGTFDGRFQSDVHGAEGSFSYELMPHGRVYVGPRWIDLNEQFDLDLTGAGGTGDFRWNTKNQLVGGQAGFRTDWIALLSKTPSKFSLVSDTSIGVFHNSASDDFKSVANGVASFKLHDGKGLPAVAVNASLTAGFRPTSNIELFAGYEVLWINGVASATDQMSGTDATNNTVSIVKGDALFHGAKVGGRIRF